MTGSSPGGGHKATPRRGAAERTAATVVLGRTILAQPPARLDADPHLPRAGPGGDNGSRRFKDEPINPRRNPDS